ncbi:hypothetical protein PT286_06915 [Neisseriaceae bacterium ESL0693]|nr:hypothetical protein [Neisseriaceae bacterium ESL0693]
MAYKVIVQNGESRQINVFPEEVNQTLWLLDSSIHKHGLGADDRKRIKDDLTKLYKAKFYLNIEELEAWAIRNRWADSSIDTLKRIAKKFL